MQDAFVETFKGPLRDECLNENLFGNRSGARRTLEQLEASAAGALTHTDDQNYEKHTRKLSL